MQRSRLEKDSLILVAMKFNIIVLPSINLNCGYEPMWPLSCDIIFCHVMDSSMMAIT